MIKKLSFVMCIVLLLGICSSNTFAVEDTTVDADFELAVSLLTYMGVIDTPKDDNLQMGVRRGEFAEYLAKMIKLNGRVMNDKAVFSDSKNLAAIENLAAVGVFKGNEEGLFCPDEVISCRDAVIAVVRLLCGDFEEDAYFNLARRLDIDRGLNLTGDLSYYNCIVLLYNAAKAEIGVDLWRSDGTVKFSKEHPSILASYYKICYSSGQVTANEYTALYSTEESDLKVNHIRVGNENFATDNKDFSDYIGQNVKFFYRQDDDKAEKVIFCLVADESANDSISIKSEDIVSFQSNTISYQDKNSKIRQLNLDKNLSVIYNGKATCRAYETVFNSLSNGTVTFYKASNTDNYSVAVIEEMKNVKATMIDQEKYLLYTDGGNEVSIIRFSETPKEHCKQEIFASDTGETVGLLSLLPNDTLSVFCSEDGDVVKIYRNMKTVVGKVQGIRSEDNYKYLSIGGDEYKCYDYISAAVGETYSFTFDKNNIVAWTKNCENESQIGYLYNMKLINGSFEDRVTAKIYTADRRFMQLDLKNKVSVNNEIYNADQVYKQFVSKGKFVRQLVYFSVNNKGELTRIDKASDSGSLSELTDGYETLNLNASLETFYPLYPYTSDTAILIVPDENSDEYGIENFAVTYMNTTTGPFVSNVNYNVRLYKTNKETPYVDYVVYQLPIVPNFSNYPPTMMVSEIKTSAVGDEVYTEITGYSEYIYKTIYVNSRVDVSGVEVGDVINVQFNAAGEIAAIRILYDYSENKTSWSGSYSYSSFFRFGTVEAVDYDPVSEKQAVITLSYDGNVAEYASNNTSDFKFVIYDPSLRKNKVYIGGIADVISGNLDSGKKEKLLIVGSARSYLQMYLFK